MTYDEVLAESVAKIAGPAPTSSPPAAAPGERKRGGPNRLAHGLHTHRWPKGCRRPANRVNRLERSLCDAVQAVDGELSLTALSTIDTACRWQKHLELAQRWLAAEFDKLDPAERLHFSRESARAAEARDKAIRLLKLDRSPGDALSDFYAELRAGAFDTPGDATDAPAALPGPQAGDSAAEALRPASDQYARPLEGQP